MKLFMKTNYDCYKRGGKKSAPIDHDPYLPESQMEDELRDLLDRKDEMSKDAYEGVGRFRVWDKEHSTLIQEYTGSDH